MNKGKSVHDRFRNWIQGGWRSIHQGDDQHGTIYKCGVLGVLGCAIRIHSGKNSKESTIVSLLKLREDIAILTELYEKSGGNLNYIDVKLVKKYMVNYYTSSKEELRNMENEIAYNIVRNKVSYGDHHDRY